jgi:hypothetical protein
MAHKKAPPVKRDAPGMKGERARTERGSLKEKRGDTLVKTIEEMYHVDFGVRDDMRLDTLKKREGVETLSQLLDKHRSK